MWFAKEKTFNATEDAVCVPQKDPIVEPVTWTITKGDHIGKHLLVFSLLQQNATFVYVDGKRKGSPGGPYCELFVQFDTADYSLLVVNTSATTAPPTTTSTAATTEAPTTGTSETPRTTTSSLPTPPMTANNFSSIRGLYQLSADSAFCAQTAEFYIN
uniref:Uncharacterized protein n=1 Tax=Meloidogyne incognita TaxID=6306 RepID=A0A914L7Y8_MELIC